MGFLKDIFGSKVKVPKFNEIDPDKEVEAAFKAIQEQLPEGKRVARSIAEADAETALAVLEQFAPGSQAAIQQQMQNIQAGLRGELPEDVQRFMVDRSVAQAQDGGFGGSQAATFGELRNLGLTSLQRIDTAMGQSAQAFQTIRGLMPQQQSVANMFLTPWQRIGVRQTERNAQFQRDMAAAEIAAQPDPVTKGLVDAGVKIAGSAIGAGLGGGMGSSLASAAGSGPTLGTPPNAQPSFLKKFLGNIGSSMMG
jgi:hypothetical protein